MRSVTITRSVWLVLFSLSFSSLSEALDPPHDTNQSQIFINAGHDVDISRTWRWPPGHLWIPSGGWPPNHAGSISRMWPPNHVWAVSHSWAPNHFTELTDIFPVPYDHDWQFSREKRPNDYPPPYDPRLFDIPAIPIQPPDPNNPPTKPEDPLTDPLLLKKLQLMNQGANIGP